MSHKKVDPSFENLPICLRIAFLSVAGEVLCRQKGLHVVQSIQDQLEPAILQLCFVLLMEFLKAHSIRVGVSRFYPVK